MPTTTPERLEKVLFLTHPLKRSIETGEGLLIYATNAVLYLAAILPHGLSWTHAGLFLVILNSVHAFQRGLLKAAALLALEGIRPIVPKLPEIPIEADKESKAV